MLFVMSTCVIQHVTSIAISFCTVDRNLVEVFTDLVQPELINIAKLAGKNAEEARRNVQSAQRAYGRIASCRVEVGQKICGYVWNT